MQPIPESLRYDEIKKLALDLLRADFESEVVNILRQAGMWDNPSYWRLLGDDENNFKIVGAQQARSEPALVEKIVNSVGGNESKKHRNH